MDKARREGMRWQLLNVLHKAVPYTASEVFLLDVMRGIYANPTALELRQQLDYLEDRGLVEINKSPHGTWYADIKRAGIDVAEYTVNCEPGIARPEKYWGDHG